MFDVNGTLTDPAGLGEAWGRPERGAGILQAAVQSAMTDTILGTFRPFKDHLHGALVSEAARCGLDPGFVDAAAERAGRLDPFPDAAAALDELRDAGVRVVALTNSGVDAGRSTLRSAGLLDRFDDVLGVDAVQAFKPDGRTYAYALRTLDVDAAHVVLVAAHGWDIAGAARAGMRTGWISREEGTLNPMVPPPTYRASNLTDMVRRIIA